MTRLIRKAIASWQRWRFLRAIPALHEINRQEAEARRKHRPTRAYQAAKKRIVLDALKHG